MAINQRGTPFPTRPTVARKLAASLFFLVFAGFGAVFIYVMGISFLWPVLQVYQWDSIPCVIEAANPAEQQLSYRYHFGNRDYSSDRWKPEERLPEEASDLEALFARYPVGSSHSCLVNPGNPEQAFLEKGSLLFLPFVLIPLIFVLIGLGGIIRIWRKKPVSDGAPKRKFVKKSISAGGDMNKSRLIGVLFFLVFFLFGAGFLYLLVVQPAIDAHRAKDWPQVPCQILSSKVRTHSDSDGNTYSVDILYKYSIEGAVYKSNRYSFFTGSSSGYSGKQEVVDKYPVGSARSCYVNPDNPTEAVLSRELGLELLWGLLPLLFILVGFGGIFFSMRSKKMLRKPALHRESRSAQKDMAPRELSSKVPYRIKPKRGRWVALLVIILAALFWNGIISVFLHEVYQDFIGGNPNWFLTLFMTPFVLIGLLMIFAIFYQILTLLTPMPLLELEQYPLHLGQDCRMHWSFQGRVSRLRELTISIEGREEATYRRGTNSSTDTSIFYERSLIKSSYHRQIAKGHLKFRVPPETVPSLSAANNRIVWAVKLHGTIDNWPDVREEFELLVLPPEGEDSWSS